MIARSDPEGLNSRPMNEPWREAYRRAYRHPQELLRDLNLESLTSTISEAADIKFPFRVTREFASRMVAGDADDPLLRQVLPVSREAEHTDGFSSDPVGEFALVGDNATLRKYHGRALVVTTGACAIHCRYCFRRDFPYSEAVGGHNFRAAINAIASDTTIEEVILSGGDPLMLDNEVIANQLLAIDSIDHVQRLRFHSRLPIVLPQRVDQNLLEIFESVRAELVVVVHTNHANEIDLPTADALQRLTGVCSAVFNQSVLLRGINDSASKLAALSRRLFSCGVVPYYLHQLDRVSGSAHFEVDDRRAQMIESELRAQLSGYLVPRLVRETPGANAKLPLV